MIFNLYIKYNNMNKQKIRHFKDKVFKFYTKNVCESS